MSRRIRIFLFLLLLAVVVTSWVVAQSDTEQPDGNLVIPGSIFVRGGPGDNYIPVGALFAGDEVTPVNRSEDGLWILILYNRGYGWVQRNLVQWEDFAALALLPVLEANVTPTPRFGTREPVLLPTFTPEGDYVLVVDAESAYLRAGPGRTYLRLGQLLPGEQVNPVSRSENGEWILIRYQDRRTGDERFAWIARGLVAWEDEAGLDELPIVGEDALTPTLTFTPSITPEPSNTATATAIPTDTTTSTNTPTVTPSDTATATDTPSITPSDTATATDRPSVTPSDTDTATATEVPSLTPSYTATVTNTPTVTPSDTATATDTPSITPSDTATDLPTATDTPTDVPTNTPTDEPTVVEILIVPSSTDTPTDEPTATDTASVTPSATATVTNTATDVPTNTPEPSDTATMTDTVVPTDTPIPTDTATDVPTASSTAETTQVAVVVLPTDEPTTETTEQALVLPETPIPTESIIIETVPPDTSGGFSVPTEAIIGIVILLIVLGYIFLYWRGLVAADRYRDGFVIDECPVCKRGGLHVDEKPGRLLGIPQVRRTVRCDVCRSVLRETGAGRWRYAVDRIENPAMFDRLNGKEITDDELVRLAGNPPTGTTRPANPQFLDEDNPDTSGR